MKIINFTPVLTGILLVKFGEAVLDKELKRAIVSKRQNLVDTDCLKVSFQFEH